MANLDRLRLLLDALRSGEYEQGIGLLRPRADAWCCLGVACDVYHKETGKGKWGNALGCWYMRGEIRGAPSGAYMPSYVSEWYGVEHNLNDPGDLETLDGQNLASKMNDGGYHFNDIADAIERKYFPKEQAP